MTISDDRTPPEHVAIIMDGNGRWANARGLPRTVGHRKGVEAVREAVRVAGDVGIRYLTLFAFSSENWRRPATEINDLFGLLRMFIRRDLAELHAENVKVRVIGDRNNLRDDILPLLIEAEETTRDNTGLTLVIAFNYGARDEIARAAVTLAREVAEGRLPPEALTVEAIGERLDTAGIPDPDVIIRTSGEERLSNFLLWQAAYSELVFVPEYWPDFSREVFLGALDRFAARERRFGGLAGRPPVAVRS
ncbi:isoprenyl transferase [Ciceribacter sp. L1K23]|uniref:isoprenyl transferase n=1 Tax=Ciceribacter sp. L1K23 TaxID=2820276 RepID=UPI001B81BDAA|nr:isoprenyl transferase [Ciceribacter sp. L1K23]MBR0555712.1 isoprenyl transferase [Ciceribacter sp. L1K23]